MADSSLILNYTMFSLITLASTDRIFVVLYIPHVRLNMLYIFMKIFAGLFVIRVIVVVILVHMTEHHYLNII